MASNNIHSAIKLDILPSLVASSLLANDLFIREFLAGNEMDKNKLVKYLKDICTEYDVMTCFLVSENSRNYYNVNGGFKIKKEDPDAAWYFRFKESGKKYELNPTINVDMENIPTIFINYRISDDRGQFSGVVGIGLEIKVLGDIIQKYSQRYDRHISLVDTGGTVILQSRGSVIRKGNISDTPGIKDKAHKILSGDVSSFEYNSDENKILVNTRYIPELGWWLFVEQEESKVLIEIHRRLVAIVMINLFTSVLAMSLVIWIVTVFQKQLEAMASTDHLTGSSNRKMFEYGLERALNRYYRTKTAFSILLLDIDRFKEVNDSLGHLEGDKILKEVTHILQSTIRTSDELSRWGGDEFVIRLSDCALEDALVVARKIQCTVENSSLANLPGARHITVSIGVTQVRENDTADTFLDRVDSVLYKAKEDGRNCIRYI